MRKENIVEFNERSVDQPSEISCHLLALPIVVLLLLIAMGESLAATSPKPGSLDRKGICDAVRSKLYRANLGVDAIPAGLSLK